MFSRLVIGRVHLGVSLLDESTCVGGGVCVGGTVRRGRRGNCAWDERRIHLKRKKALGL